MRIACGLTHPEALPADLLEERLDLRLDQELPEGVAVGLVPLKHFFLSDITAPGVYIVYLPGVYIIYLLGK